MDDQIQREETMLYREPTDDSEKIEEIWGRELETRVVDAAEVPEMLSSGWVVHPLDLGKKPEERAGFERVPRQADRELELAKEAAQTAEKLVRELTAENEKLRADLAAAEALLAEKKPTLTVKGGK